MNRARHAMAVVLVATALCADGRLAAAPCANADSSSAPQNASLAARLVSRLSDSFRGAVCTVAIVYQSRQDLSAPVSLQAAIIVDQPQPTHQLLTPFQFRLPPPCK